MNDGKPPKRHGAGHRLRMTTGTGIGRLGLGIGGTRFREHGGKGVGGGGGGRGYQDFAEAFRGVATLLVGLGVLWGSTGS